MPADWTRVTELFHQALDRRGTDRDAYLEAQCGGDEELRREVASLLAANEQAGDFMESPAIASLSSGAPHSRHAVVPVGTVLGHYRVSRVLGEGGMGVVYLADDTRLGRPVALKAVAGVRANSTAARERLMHEARTAARLQHPGIATVYALEEIDGQLFIASEYVPGDTLRQELQRGPLGAAQVLDTALQLARALQRAHELGVVHRDLKPENIIRTPSGQLKILDFGLAGYREAFGMTDQELPLLAGTPAYMSPEQIRGDAVDPRSDLFSLGIVLYELSTGTHPLPPSAPAAATLSRVPDHEPAPMPVGGDRTAARLSSIISTCLQQMPEARFATTSDLVAALERVRTEEKPGPAILATPRPVDRTAKARWWWVFHQLTASAVYVALLLPLWTAHRISAPSTPWLFFAGVVSMAVASTLRLNLVFTAQSLPEQADGHRRAVRRWIVAADLAFAVTLLGGAVAAIPAQAFLAALLLVAAVATFLAALVIEPATTNAAFDAR